MLFLVYETSILIVLQEEGKWENGIRLLLGSKNIQIYNCGDYLKKKKEKAQSLYQEWI